MPLDLTRLKRRLAEWRGTTIVLDLGAERATLAEIDELGRELHDADDGEIRRRVRQLRDRARSGVAPGEQLVEAYAMIREACERALGQRPYDEQMLGAIALHHGNVVEMQTGEGKTLAAVMPTALHAFAGGGAHVLTFNDYLARRDAAWMGPIYEFLGLTVGVVQQESTADERRRAYAHDVTYVTAKQAGFDLLRDQRVLDESELVHRPFRFALIDEADSLLIDEARVPLVLAGDVSRGGSSANRLSELVERFTSGCEFTTDEYDRNVWLTDKGLDRAEAELDCGDLHDEQNRMLFAELNCALHAAVLLRRDVDYLVRDGDVQLVDELTGRSVPDRHWPDGLQTALRAKERVELKPEGQVLTSITLQHFLSLYSSLCGMTGTAQDSAEELDEFYELGVVVIPTHRPTIRVDRDDVVFTCLQAKEAALIEEIERAHRTGRPVLVGTLTIEESERVAGRLRDREVDCRVLNARTDEAEARIVARAGEPGAVTISTNMAGRGTDIRLGGEHEERRDEVVALGGLYVIGTNRHESRRIDRQLRGRAGRQGDPGESRLFISLEDELIVRFGVRRLLPRVPEPQDEPIDDPVIRREIARAQRIIEGQNYDIRRELWRYSMQLEDQRRAVQQQRSELLDGQREHSVLKEFESDRHAELVETLGEGVVCDAERTLTLALIDQHWSDYLALVADLREGIHHVRAGGRDPLTEFRNRTHEAFGTMRGEVENDVARIMRTAQISADGLDLARVGLRRPTSTWTYLVNDNPLRDRLSEALTGPGNAGFAVGAALYAGWILIPWGIYRAWRERRRKRENPDRPARR